MSQAENTPQSSFRPYVPDEGTTPLTPLQSRLLARAWVMGYYAVPRRITLTRLAQQTGRSAPALGKVLRRAEGRIVARWLSTEGAVAESEASEPGPVREP